MSLILFYSNGCEYSKKFLYYIDTYGVSDEFIKASVDKTRKTNMRPRYVYDYKITEVPTIISSDMNLRLSGAKAFKYLADIVNNKSLQYERSQERRYEQQPENINQDDRMRDDRMRDEHIQDSRMYQQEVQDPVQTRNKIKSKSKKRSQYLDSKTSVISDFINPFCKVGENVLSNIPDNVEDRDVKIHNKFEIQDDFSEEINSGNTIKVKKGSLKEKQLDNRYSRMLSERKLDTKNIVRI